VLPHTIYHGSEQALNRVHRQAPLHAPGTRVLENPKEVWWKFSSQSDMGLGAPRKPSFLQILPRFRCQDAKVYRLEDVIFEIDCDGCIWGLELKFARMNSVKFEGFEDFG
jgi:hypothetical protein